VEVYQHFSDPPLTECGVCGGALRKVFHPAGILFKGSGFYATDSRRRAASTTEGSSKGDDSSQKDSAPKGPKEPAAGASGDAKPAGPPPKNKEKSA
jgi:predicted nucleic acid-binding Zn ribbon protein